MLKFPARKSYCVTLIVFVLLTSQETLKNNNTEQYLLFSNSGRFSWYDDGQSFKSWVVWFYGHSNGFGTLNGFVMFSLKMLVSCVISVVFWYKKRCNFGFNNMTRLIWTAISTDTFYRAFSLTWPGSMQIYGNKREHFHKKRVQLPQNWFGTPTWLPFHCFETPIWPPRPHVKTLYCPWSVCINGVWL